MMILKIVGGVGHIKMGRKMCENCIMGFAKMGIDVKDDAVCKCGGDEDG